jgi:hypothetical protein
MQKKNKKKDRKNRNGASAVKEVGATQAREGMDQDNSAQASEVMAESPQVSMSEADNDSATTQDSTGAVSASDEDGTADKPLPSSDADDQNDSSDEVKEAVTDDASAASESEGQQTSGWEGESDSFYLDGLRWIPTEETAQRAISRRGKIFVVAGEAPTPVTQYSGHTPLKMIGDEGQALSGRIGSENQPMVAPDADDHNSKPSETPTDESAGASDADTPPNLDKDKKPKDDDERAKELSKEKIDELVHRAMANHASADVAALNTGMMFLDEVFGGSLSQALSHNPKKQKSFGKICGHPDMDIDPTTLSRWVRAANLVKTFERAGKKFQNLTCSHYIALLRLKHYKNQLRLAEEANNSKISVRQLTEEIERVETTSPKTLLEEISSRLGSPKELPNDDDLNNRKKWTEELTQEDRKALIDRVSKAKLEAQTYVNRLARFHTFLEEIAAEIDK